MRVTAQRWLFIVLTIGLFVLNGQAWADIFQWEFVNPTDPSQGKQQSTTLCPDGAGVSAVSDSSLGNRNLTMAYLAGVSLSNVDFSISNLTNADLNTAFLSSVNFTGTNLHQADLTNVFLQDATLVNADLSQADLRNVMLNRVDLTDANLTGALIQGVTGYTGMSLTQTQLFSTASYQAHDLHGTFLAECNFAGSDFSNQNLAGGAIGDSNLNGASFHQANLTGTALGYSPYLGSLPSTLVGADFSNANLTQANLVGSDLSGANFTGAQIHDANFSKFRDTGIGGITPAQLVSTASYQANDLGQIALAGNNLAGADLSGLKLVQVDFSGATLTGANFTGAIIRGSYFNGAIGLTPGQLYVTASYQVHDLPETDFENLDLPGVNFVGQNLMNSNFAGGKVSGGDFSNAILTGVRFDSGVYVGTPITVVGNAKFAGADLSGADFIGTDVSAIDLTSAMVKNASFNRIIPGGVGSPGDNILKDGVGGLTVAQLYSTASYHSHDLSGISLGYNDLTGVNLSGQNLFKASFGGAVLKGANFSHANLIRTTFYSADLTDADFTAADTRNANLFYDSTPQIDFKNANLTNTIRPDGHISGLDLQSGQFLVIRNSNPESFSPPPGIFILSYYIPAIPVAIDQHFNMGPGGILQLLFEANPWNSVISFQSGIPIALGGTLDLEFTSDVDVGAEVGRTIHLFDWSGVSPTDTFTIGGPYSWDVSQLYTTGDVTLTAVPEPSSIMIAAICSLGMVGYVVCRRAKR